MLIDARNLPEGTTIDTDVCIIGAGAAGITLAREFRSQAFQVCLLESGGFDPAEETQLLYAGEVTGLTYPPLAATRLRYFGGTTNHWTGWCQPLDGIDFESRDWISHSGWPFDRSHLNPFYERAQSLLQLGPFIYEPATWQTEEKPQLPFRGDRVRTKIVQFSPPTRFGRYYRHEIVKAANINTYLHANALEIETAEDGRTVGRVRVGCLEGNSFSVSARIFILAAGGIENARLLLLSNKVQKAGLGNQNDLVGRFFMDHFGLESGLILLSDTSVSPDLYTYDWQNPLPMGQLILSDKTMRKEKLSNFCAHLRETRWSNVWEEHDLLSAIRTVLRNIDDIALGIYRRRFNQPAHSRLFEIYSIVEPEPNRDSRVALSEERDRLGQHQVQLRLQLSAQDKRTLQRSHEIIAAELGRANLGRLQVMLDRDDRSWPDSLTYDSHHMGTTRMHADPKMGVVDSNCKVHGVSNLFIAGSSVFPTYGYAQPTLTIIALALRLADHLKQVLTQ